MILIRIDKYEVLIHISYIIYQCIYIFYCIILNYIILYCVILN